MNTDDQGVTAEFGTVRRGYDTDQVDQYITSLQASTRAEIEACRERLTETEAALATAKQREEAVHLMLVAASQTKEEMVTAARQEVEDATTHAEEDAETIVAEAKREAFALVTDARSEADTALEEARAEAAAIVAKALQEAQAIVAEPELYVIAPVADGAAAEAAEQRIGELGKKEVELEHRIEQLNAVAAELETRMADFARGALGELAEAEVAEQPSPLEQETTPEAPVTGTLEPEIAATFNGDLGPPPADERPISTSRPLTEEELPPVIRKSWIGSADTEPEIAAELAPTTASVEEAAPPVEPAIADEPLEHTPVTETIGNEGDADADVEAEAAASLTNRSNAPRGSFYSRRSAKLPRIGTEAGRGALAAVNAMRNHSAHLHDESADDESEEAGDFAAQSA